MKNRVSRRTFHRVGTAAWGTLAFGCGYDQREALDGESPSRGSGGGSPTSGGSGGHASGGSASGGQGMGGARPGPSGGMGGVLQTCGELTASNIEGPFFLANSPERTDIRESQPGPQLLLTGTVFDSGCRPVAGALIDFWQANDEGAYDNAGTQFRGHQRTAEDGTYSLSSIIPGRYLNGSQYRPAHLHVKVTAGQRTLTTQLYFPDDPYNDVDPFIDFSLIVDITGSQGDVTLATFDFHVPLDT